MFEDFFEQKAPQEVEGTKSKVKSQVKGIECRYVRYAFFENILRTVYMLSRGLSKPLPPLNTILRMGAVSRKKIINVQAWSESFAGPTPRPI